MDNMKLRHDAPGSQKRNVIICVFVFILCGCKNNFDDGFLCRYLYFPTSTNKNHFWVEVKEDSTMKVTFGDVTWDCHHIIIHGSFPKEGMEWERIKAEDSIVIDLSAYGQIEVLASEVRKRESVNRFIEDGVSDDGMGTVLFIKDKYYYVELGDYQDKPTEDLIEKLKEISPIPIRDSVGSVLQDY